MGVAARTDAQHATGEGEVVTGGLDCNTDRGRLFIARQHEIINRCAPMWESRAVLTPDDRESPVDAMFYRGDLLTACAEVKARDMTEHDLVHRYRSYLVTYDKLDRGRAIAKSLCVPYLLIVGLWPERLIVWWKVADSGGRWLVPFVQERTATQATCNGGTATRVNAYVGLESMRRLDSPGAGRPFTAPTGAKAGPFLDPALTVATSSPLTADDIDWGFR